MTQDHQHIEWAHEWMTEQYPDWHDQKLSMEMWVTCIILTANKEQTVDYYPVVVWAPLDGPGVARILEEAYLAVTNATPNKLPTLMEA
jgi:hypothetical protein